MAISRNKVKQAKRLYREMGLEAISALLGVDAEELAEALRKEGLEISGRVTKESVRFPFGKARWLILVFLAGVVLLAYSNSYNNVFHYDDYHSLTENIHIRKLSNIPKFFKDPQTFSSKIGVKMVRPILLTTFALNYAWTEYRAWSWILVNILIHLLNVLMVYVFLVHLTGRQKFAVIASLVFALHPVNTETVNYINCRSSLLVSTFMLVSIYAFARAIFQKNWVWQLVSVICFGLGFLVKEEAIVVLALVLVLDVLFFWKKTRGDIFNRVMIHYAPYLGVIIIYFIYRNWALRYLIQDVSPRPLLLNLQTQTRCLVHYLNLLIMPIHQNTSYENIEYESLIGDKVLLAGLYLSALLGVGLYFWKKYPLLIFFLLWFFITLAPTTVVPLNAIMNEHRLYLPSLGLGLLVSGALESLDARLSDFRRDLAGICLLFIFLAFSVLSLNRNRVWIGDMDLWRDAIKKSPRKAQVISDLGNAYFRKEPSDLNRAEQLYKWAVMVDPSYFKAYHNLAIVNFRRGDEIAIKDQAKAEEFYRTAIGYFQQAIEVSAVNPDSWNDMGTTYFKLKDYENAERCYLKAIQINPLAYKSYASLCYVYAQQKRFSEAEDACTRSLQIYDKDPLIWFGLGQVQAQQGKYDEALRSASQALELAPENEALKKLYNQFYDLVQRLKASPPAH